MRKIAMIALVAILLAGCPVKEDKPPRPLVATSVVKICLDDTTLIRQEDARCSEELDIYRWVYISDSPAWPPELPAVGEYIQGGRFTEVRPDAIISYVPREGGTFPNP